MKHCTICERELPTTLDEFGPAQFVLCRDCYWEQGHTVNAKIASLPPAYAGTVKLESLKWQMKKR